jgi:hypothetical protein
MADPLSLLAVAALVYTGRQLSEKSEPPQKAPEPPLLQEEPQEEIEVEDGLDFDFNGKREMGSFATIAPQKRTSGGEMLEMRNRMYDTGRMGNVSPVERQLVGPGLGLDANTPALGGYQQLFRVMPENVGAYRLTTLRGGTGPAFDHTGGRASQPSIVQNNRPEKTAFLPDRLPPTAGRAAVSGAVIRSEHEKTKRTTNRSQTGMRTDGLDKGAAKRFISAQTVPQLPTRFKTDANTGTFWHVNNPQPGIHSFHGGYTVSPAAQAQAKTNDELMRLGLRPEDKRGMPGRMNNPGRMNVRGHPSQQGGALTSVRADVNTSRFNAPNGGWTQDYKRPQFQDLNAYKGNVNPNATVHALDLAKRQLSNNPFAHTLSAN